jgi:hypothetical protein
MYSNGKPSGEGEYRWKDGCIFKGSLLTGLDKEKEYGASPMEISTLDVIRRI